jgi:dolichol kinase
MFLCTYLLLVIALLFYAVPMTTRVTVYLFCMSGVVTVIEGVTPLGLDNLSVPFVAALMYWFFLVG